VNVCNVAGAANQVGWLAGGCRPQPATQKIGSISLQAVVGSDAAARSEQMDAMHSPIRRVHERFRRHCLRDRPGNLARHRVGSASSALDRRLTDIIKPQDACGRRTGFSILQAAWVDEV
jgi:hypothetical protein